MASQYDLTEAEDKPQVGFQSVLMTRSIVIDGDSRDPLANGTEERIPAMTPMAPCSGGKYKPIRRTLADGSCTTGETVVPVTETTMFAVGDVVEVVDLTDPAAAGAAMGTIESISAGVSITLAATSTTAVDSGDIVEVAENADADDVVILLREVDLRNADGTAVDTGSAGVKAGQCLKSSLNFCSAAGIAVDRLESNELDQMDLVAATAGA